MHLLEFSLLLHLIYKQIWAKWRRPVLCCANQLSLSGMRKLPDRRSKAQFGSSCDRFEWTPYMHVCYVIWKNNVKTYNPIKSLCHIPASHHLVTKSYWPVPPSSTLSLSIQIKWRQGLMRLRRVSADSPPHILSR